MIGLGRIESRPNKAHERKSPWICVGDQSQEKDKHLRGATFPFFRDKSRHAQMTDETK